VTPPAGTTVIVGNNLYADNSVLGVRSTVGAPTTIPDTAIRVLERKSSKFESTPKIQDKPRNVRSSPLP
jgi:hypothetical protein